MMIRRRGEAGITILEILVAFTLLGLVLLTGSAVFGAGFRTLMTGRGMADEHQNGRLVLEWMTRRIRLAGLNTPRGTTEFFTEAAANAVALQADVNGDGTAEMHRFCLEPTQGVVREEVGAAGASCTTATGTPITSRGVRPLRIVRLDFAYYDGLGNALTPLPLAAASRTLIARVQITLGLDSNRSGVYDAPDLTFTMDSTV